MKLRHVLAFQRTNDPIYVFSAGGSKSSSLFLESKSADRFVRARRKIVISLMYLHTFNFKLSIFYEKNRTGGLFVLDFRPLICVRQTFI